MIAMIFIIFTQLVSIPIVFYENYHFVRQYCILNTIMMFAMLSFGVINNRSSDIYKTFILEECDNPIGAFSTYNQLYEISNYFMCSEDCPCISEPTGEYGSK
jgi:hypothetical protein